MNPVGAPDRGKAPVLLRLALERRQEHPDVVEENAAGLTMRLGDGIVLPIPPERTERYRRLAGKPATLGLRPERITDCTGPADAHSAEFSVRLDVVEPMGMETMIFFSIGGSEVSGRVDPDSMPAPGETMRLRAHLRHMHLIDPGTNLVV